MSFEFTGKVLAIGEVEQVTETFKKRNLDIDTGGDYPQVIRVEFLQDHCDLLDKVSVGQAVIVSFNLRGRQWKDKVFNSLQGWRVQQAKLEEPNFMSATVAKNAQVAPSDNVPF